MERNRVKTKSDIYFSLGSVLAIKAKDWCYDCSILSINTFAIILKRSEDEGTNDFVYKAITF